MAHSTGRIPIPASRRLRMFCHGVLPVLAFLGAGGVVAYLMMQDQTATGMTGELFARRTMVNAQVAGVLASPASQPIAEFTAVRKGQVVAQLDPRPLQARLKVVQAELEKAKADISATQATQESDTIRVLVSAGGNAAQLTSDVARLRVEQARVEAEEAVARISWGIAKKTYDLIEYLVNEKKVLPKTDLYNAQKVRDEAKATADTRVVMRKQIIEQIGKINEKLAGLPKPPSSQKLQELLDNLLSPIQAQIKTQQAIIEEVQTQMEQLVIHAPFDGVITQVHLHPGQAVQPGTPIFTLAAADAPYVLTYIRSNQPIRPRLGMGADVRFSARGGTVPGRIVLIGPEVTDISPKQLQNPSVPEWGLPVAIQLQWPPKMKDELDPRPGQLVYIRLRPNDVDNRISVAQDVAIHGGELVLSSN